MRRRWARLLHVAHVVVNHALRNAVPLVVLAVLGGLAFAIAAEVCCPSDAARQSTAPCCQLAIDCDGRLGPFPFPTFRAGAVSSEASEKFEAWKQAMFGLDPRSP